MNKTTLLVFLAFQICNHVLTNSSSNKSDRSAEDLNLFQQFRTRYNVRFGSISDLNHRLTVFKQNLKIILEKKDNTETGYTLGINQFADLTFQEFSSKFLGKTSRTSFWDWINNIFKPKDKKTNLYVVNDDRKTEKKDWRDVAGAIGPVRDQGKCGSCWSFAAIDLAEQSRVILKGLPYIDLSTQELVDCSKEEGSRGCQGGWETGALTYLKNNGVNLAQNYEYLGKEQTCKAIAKPGVNKIDGFVTAADGPEPAIQALKTRTVTVAFHVRNDFQFYKDGIYNPVGCSDVANHVVVIVAYDLTGPTPFFTYKNSWGNGWGESGFARVAIAQGNGICGSTAPRNINYITAN